MADWQEQLNTILSDPDAMAQIVSLAQSISAQPSGAGHTDGSEPPSGPEPAPSGAAAEHPDGGAATQAAPGGLDPELLRRIGPLLQQMNRPESSDAAAFLQALRPFLSEKRRGKVERAAQLARLIHLGKTFLTTQGQEEAERV